MTEARREWQCDGRANAFIQARMSSTRLPGKVMLPLAGKPMIWHIWSRAARCREVSTVAVITSTDPSDDPLATFCAENKIPCYRSSLENVLDRYAHAARWKPCDYVVRITGDCPLIEPKIIDHRIRALRTYQADVTWFARTSPATAGQSVVARWVLEYVASRSSDKRDLEHVGNYYIFSHMDEFRVVEFHIPDYLAVSGLRLTVDEAADYELMQCIYDHFWPQRGWVPLPDVLTWLREHPEIAQMNANVQHNDISTEIVERSRRWQHLPKVGVWEMTA